MFQIGSVTIYLHMYCRAWHSSWERRTAWKCFQD